MLNVLNNKPTIIPNASSLVLDGLRLTAALVVLLHHADDIWFPSFENPDTIIGKSAHAAVVIFFALSGYVIAYTTTSNNRGPLQYAKSRLSRLCSIVIPALIITAIIENAIRQINPALYLEYARENSWIRYIMCSVFSNEVWFFSSAPPINSPLWSLSFEFWYYAIFGFWFYRKNNHVKSFVLPMLVCIIAGPKIILMMPIWLLGFAAYYLPKPSLTHRQSWICVCILFLITMLVVIYIPSMPFEPGALPFIFASQFVTDWIIGLCISLMLWFFPLSYEKSTLPPSKGMNIIRKIADLTFPIYVLDKPLLVLFRSVIDFKIHDVFQEYIITGLVLLICAILGLILEHYKSFWAHLFEKILLKIKILILKASMGFK